MRATVVVMALALSGCSLLVKPNYDAIAPDLDAGTVDAGPDADAGVDSGIDSGVDGGSCIPGQFLESNCEDGEDNDCDGTVDCFDFDCRGDATCCRGGDSSAECLSSTAFQRLPIGTSDILFTAEDCSATDTLTEFGPPGLTRALVSQECKPINFGMELSATFEVTETCAAGTCDYAALALTPLRVLADGDPLVSELRVVVSANGSVSIDRAGTRIGTSLPAGTLRASDRAEIQIDLEPGPDDRGRDVLFATVDVVGRGRLLERTAVMPLDTLRCIGPSGNEVGLYVAIEGAGSDVRVVGPLATTERACSNPSQFRPQAAALDTPASCAPGGAGAPALVSYCRSNCTGASPQFQSDLWVDASEDQRADETIRFVDFGVCGFAAQRSAFPRGTVGDDWALRGSTSGFLWSIDPEWRSGREPTLLPISNDGAASTRVSELWFAYAERMEDGFERYAIHGGRVFAVPTTTRPVRADTPLLTPGDVGCTSLRDPLWVAHYASGEGPTEVDGAWLLFTCERSGGATRSIGAVRFNADFARIPSSSVTVLSSAIGSYAERGVYAAEGFSERGEDGELTLRVWFSARDGRGRVRLAYAQGRSDDPDALPVMEPYPANPILAGDSAILGGDCSAGCTLTGASVTPSTELIDYYQFVIARSRITAAGPVHDLVPLLQPAPDD